MRAWSVRPVAASVLSSALLLGAVVPAHAATRHDTAGRTAAVPEAPAHQAAQGTVSRGPVAQGPARQAPEPGSDDLLSVVLSLGNVGGVLKPVTDLLSDALRAPDGKLPEEDLVKHTDAITYALDRVEADTQGTGPTPASRRPGTPQLSVRPPLSPTSQLSTASRVPALSQRPLTSQLPAGSAPVGKASLDVKRNAVAAQRKAVDALAEAVTAGDSAAVAKQVPAVTTGMVDLVVGTYLSGGLPAEQFPGLAELHKPAV